MKVYVLMIEPRASEPTAQVFADREKAISQAEYVAHRYARTAGKQVAKVPPPPGLIGPSWLASWAVLGHFSAWVVETELLGANAE